MSIFFADSAGSQGTGDGSTAADAATLKQVLEEDPILYTYLLSEDKVWVKGGTTITESITITFDGLVEIEGYTTTTGDNGVFVIDAENTRANCILNDGSANSPGLILRNAALRNATQDCYEGSGFSNQPGTLYENCEFSGAGIRGCNLNYNGGGGRARSPTFINCLISDNGDHGIHHGQGDIHCFGSVFLRNGGQHVELNPIARDALFYKCIFDDTEGHVVSAGGATFLDCTFNDTIATKNVLFSQASAAGYGAFVFNCGFTNLVGDIIRIDGEAANSTEILLRNCGFFNNSGSVSTSSVSDIADSVNGDPLYTDDTNADFSISPGSPWVNAATPSTYLDGININYSDIGAVHRIAAGRASDYMEEQVMSYVFNSGYAFQPDNVWLALYTSNPTDNNSGTEVSGNGYARQLISFGSPLNGTVSNDSEITFPVASASWGTITHWAVFDSATNGNMLVYSEILPNQSIASSDMATIASGIIQITID